MAGFDTDVKIARVPIIGDYESTQERPSATPLQPSIGLSTQYIALITQVFSYFMTQKGTGSDSVAGGRSPHPYAGCGRGFTYPTKKNLALINDLARTGTNGISHLGGF